MKLIIIVTYFVYKKPSQFLSAYELVLNSLHLSILRLKLTN